MGAARSAGGLRGELTEFVGRRGELARVRDALEGARLVTLTGPGGIGKTRLALQVAAGAGRAFRDGVWLAELGELRDPGLLVAEVARALGLSDQSARWAVASLGDHLQNRQVLLVLDGCEHLADACAVLADALLRGCPGLRLIATSRHVLGVAGEVTIAVPPMTVPAEGAAAPEELLGYEAVRLFAGRGAAVLPGFAVDAGNGAAVAGVCRALDGIPLAIELAAVRLRSLSPEQILSRLGSRFQLLCGGPAGAPRHRTLQAALEWSYELLTEAEQAMWRRMSVFAGSFDLDAAEAVCAVGRVATGEIADLVDALVAKSILLREGQGPARYRLLDTIREFGLTKLRGRGNERILRLRHRAWYAALAARQEAFGPGRAAWIAALDTDHENLRAALRFCLSEPGETAAGAQMACDLWRYWETHGHITEGRRVLAGLLERLDPTAPAPRALWVAGYLAMLQGDLPAARTVLEAGLSAARMADDDHAEAWAMSFLGFVTYSLGKTDDGQALAGAALRRHEETGDQIGIALALAQTGFIRLCSGEPRMAADLYTQCGRVSESSGNVWYQAYAQWGVGVATWLLGDPCGAAAPVRAALSVMRRADDPIGVALCLDALAWIAASRHETARSLALLAAADKAWAAIPAPLPVSLRVHHEEVLGEARKVLPAAEFRAVFAKGSTMDQAEAIAFALGESSRPRPDAGRVAGSGPGPLTRREQDVAGLVAEGMSNSQIAASLVISVRTVETHIQHIMDKLGCGTRAQIAAWSAARPR